MVFIYFEHFMRFNSYSNLQGYLELIDYGKVIDKHPLYCTTALAGGKPGRLTGQIKTYRGSELNQPSNLEARDLVCWPALSGEKFHHSLIARNCEELRCELRSVNHQSGFAIITSFSPYILGSHSGG